ncbi:MAG: methyl-accepting chemotaxis protein [Butyrivibrio sp.]|nr:methyl-accepting chemotaxis protein [Butyrivibrio sp.]
MQTKTRSMRTTLLMIILPFTIAIVALIAFFSSEMTSVSDESETVYYEHLYQINSALVNADRDLYQAFMAATHRYDIYYGYSQITDEDVKVETLKTKLDDYNENVKEARDRVQEALAIAKEEDVLYNQTMIDGMTIAQYGSAFEKEFNAWLDLYDFNNMEGDWGSYQYQFKTARADLSNMTDIVEQWAVGEKTALENSIKKTILISGIIALVIAAILFVYGMSVANKITRMLNMLSDTMERMAGGDLATQIKARATITEFAKIVHASEDMRSRLQTAVRSVISHAQNVNEKAEGTKERIIDSQKTTSDINSAVADLAQGATVMAEDVQNTASMTVNIGAAIDAVKEKATVNMENGRTVYEESVRVQEQLRQIQASDQQTDAIASEVAESVSETAKVVDEISTAAEAIISIASQTNLLALNASIEAARAGDAGKGFAVVADNIGNLAADSNKTASEITTMLDKITQFSNRNKELTGSIKEATTNENAALQEMMTSFDNMLKLLQETEKGTREIVELTENLNSDKSEISNSVESLSSVSEENAASTQQTSASLTQLDTNMENVAGEAEELQQIAEELKHNVAFFKVD